MYNKTACGKAKLIKCLGAIIRDLRQCKGIKVDFIANKLGYENAESYFKLERGEKGDIGINQLLIICEILGCSLASLFMLAGLSDELFNENITTWDEFYESADKLPKDRKERMLEIMQKIKLYQLDL